MLAGNVPGVGVFGIVAALLAGVPSLVKPAAREPFLPALMVESIAAVAPELQPAVALAPWRGGTAELDEVALRDADVVLAYGRDETLDHLAAHRPRRLLRFGNRVSVAVVARGALTRTTARALAQQVALYDQQGCLSPQIACVEEGDRDETATFTALVAAELGALEDELPRAAPTLAESAAVWRFLERQRWRAQEGADVTVDGGGAGRASVVCDRTAAWSMSPTFRHLVVLPVTTLAGCDREVARRSAAASKRSATLARSTDSPKSRRSPRTSRAPSALSPRTPAGAALRVAPERPRPARQLHGWRAARPARPDVRVKRAGAGRRAQRAASTAALARDFRLHVAQTSTAPLGLVITHARGAWITDAAGRRYLDLLSGMGVANLGHGNRAVLRACAAQLRRHLHVMVYGEYVLPAQVALATRLTALAGPPFESCYFTNSGAEAIEGALKTARKYTGRSGLVGFALGFHGDTFGALSVGGNPRLSRPVRAVAAGGDDPPLARRARAPRDRPANVAAVVIEPVQAEGGVRVADPAFLRAAPRRAATRSARCWSSTRS